MYLAMVTMTSQWSKPSETYLVNMVISICAPSTFTYWTYGWKSVFPIPINCSLNLLWYSVSGQNLHKCLEICLHNSHKLFFELALLFGQWWKPSQMFLVDIVINILVPLTFQYASHFAVGNSRKNTLLFCYLDWWAT